MPKYRITETVVYEIELEEPNLTDEDVVDIFTDLDPEALQDLPQWVEDRSVEYVEE